MSTTYTRDQITQAVKDAYGVQLAEADTAARTLAAALGLTVEPEPLESGVYRHEDGRLVHLRDYSTLAIMDAHVNSPWAKENRDKLTPARVVPEAECKQVESDLIAVKAQRRNLFAEVGRLRAALDDEEQSIIELTPAEPTLPAPLTEEQVGELWDKVTSSGVADWIDYRTPRRVAIQRTVNAALAKYGHGTTTPSRDDVEKALVSNMISLKAMTDAVMALLEGGTGA